MVELAIVRRKPFIFLLYDLHWNRKEKKVYPMTSDAENR